MENYGSNPNGSKKTGRRFKLFLLFLALLLVSSVWVTTVVLSKANQIFDKDQSIFKRISQLFSSAKQSFPEQKNGKINLLFLGMGGVGHEGPLLTDTVIVAEVNLETSEVVLVSVPRDFIVKPNDSGYAKINSVYAYAEQARKGSGGEAAIKAIQAISGLNIPYFITIDFAGFVKAVDDIGGLNIFVEKTFTDESYPDNKFGYLPPLTFKRGWEHMDGKRALQFVRSRQGNNAEGSDFARSERQKKIMVAFLEKVVKLNLTDIKTINNLLNDFTTNVRTNLEPEELKKFAEISKAINAEKVYSLALSPDGNLICDGIIEDYTARAYVIQPCPDKSYADLHEFIAGGVIIAKLKKENPAIEIQNSTGDSKALAALKSINLLGSNLKTITFKSRTPYERTIIYDNSKNGKPNTLEYIKINLNFTFADIPYTNSNADFVIILGKDAL